jgi:hypothetical protein
MHQIGLVATLVEEDLSKNIHPFQLTDAGKHANLLRTACHMYGRHTQPGVSPVAAHNEAHNAAHNEAQSVAMPATRGNPAPSTADARHKPYIHTADPHEQACVANSTRTALQHAKGAAL